MRGSRKRREIGLLGFQKLVALAEAQTIASRMVEVALGTMGSETQLQYLPGRWEKGGGWEWVDV